MPRNHPRLNQTSTSLIQSWRGNCDIQLLIYDSHPDYVDLKEISKVTDYVVSYSCKGNSTLREEVETNRRIILGMEETTGDKADLQRVCKKILNKASASRLISKQEACVLLGNLDLTSCTEYIETVSISNSKRLSLKGDTSSSARSLLTRYASRSLDQEHLSLHEFYPIFRKLVKGKKPSVAHYVGLNGYPTFPVTEAYARHVLIVYKPWRSYPNQKTWKTEFDSFIRSSECPKPARLTYLRVLQRYYDRTSFVEPVAKTGDYHHNPISEMDAEALLLAGLGCEHGEEQGDLNLQTIYRGKDFRWDKKAKERNISSNVADTHEDTHQPEDWLMKHVSNFHDSLMKNPMIPLNDKGEPYSLEQLYQDQKFIAYKVLDKIREWAECEDLSNFQPLRCTLQGQAGCGKSILINTITAVLRTIFDYNNVIATGCATGTAAFNAFGETLHHLTGQGIKGEYIPFTMSAAKKRMLCEKFKHLLCLIIDERSLLTSKLLGSTGQMISETIFNGSNLDDILGGLPVIILAGDDFQLPGWSDGAFEALYNNSKTKMTEKGREIFRQCATTAFKLEQIRRVSDSKQDDKDMLARIRVGEGITDHDVSKLQSLHIDNIRRVHGDAVVKEIEEDAIYIFWTNQKRVEHNFHRLSLMNSPENPTAILKVHTFGEKYGKSISSHFDSPPPRTALLCIGAKVCLQGKNFNPLWGLHNGACGTVQEIVFSSGHNPNNGDLPQYVVVNFPQYCGPAWDVDNPKDVPIPVVTTRCKHTCCQRQYVPLELAFARTLHRFQGLSAGPVDPGKIPNAFKVIICDPDCHKVEGICSGFFYTMVSRATTFGDCNGLHSAIYFTGPHLTKDRIQKLTLKTRTQTPHINIQRRLAWVEHLDKYIVKPSPEDATNMQRTFEWCKRKISYDTLHERSRDYINAHRKKT